jgi:hypothetical protein
MEYEDNEYGDEEFDEDCEYVDEDGNPIDPEIVKSIH